ncbi:MAG: DUF1553 domain-containing protein, partial [Gemmataceae bacterium]
DRYRRGIYTIWRRSSPYPSFSAFDAPDRSSCTVKRPRTNTPLQALTLMNDPVYVEAAIAFGHRVLNERQKASDRERLTYAFRLVLSRTPSDRELLLLEQLLERAKRRYANAPKDAQQILQNASTKYAEDPVTLAAWFQVGTVLLNLDETITKG